MLFVKRRRVSGGRDVCESDCALNSLIYNPPTILMNTIIIPRSAQELLPAA